MFSEEGRLKYSIKDEYYRLVAEIDPEIHRYFRSLIPKYYLCRPQRYHPHITVVRGESPKIKEMWNAYENEMISFEYDSYLYHDKNYWWFNCYSEKLKEIRLELGLPSSYYLTRPPNDAECFHSTIGNSKEI